MGLLDQFKTIGLLVLGAVILIAHVVVFILNQFIFTVMLSLYIIGYTVLILVITYKKRNCYGNTTSTKPFNELNLIYNMSIYTIFLQVFLIILSLGYMFAQKYIKKY